MTFHKIFFGSTGLRAGWRVAMFIVSLALCVLLLGSIANAIVHRLHPHNVGHGFTPLGALLGEIVVVLGLLLAMALVRSVEGLGFAEFGMPMRLAFGRQFWMGAVWGFAALSALIGVMKLMGDVELGHVIDPPVVELKDALLYAATFVLVGIFEEFSFRGYIQWALTRGLRFWPAAIITSLIFGLAHAGNPGEHWYGLLPVVGIGLLFCLFLLRTGNLWFPIGFHFAWDWAETYFYGAPDSGGVANGSLFRANFHGPTWVTGGTVGPEGSAFVWLVIVIAAAVFAYMYRDRKYFPEQVVSKHSTQVAPTITATEPLPETL